MSVQLSTTVRNAMLDQIETTISTAPILTIRTGAQPANCAAANSGTVLATMTLPSDWMAAASSGSKAKSGTWQDVAADASGTAAHYRIHDSSGTVCHLQGSVGLTSSGADMELDNTNLATGQAVTVSAFSLSAANS